MGTASAAPADALSAMCDHGADCLLGVTRASTPRTYAERAIAPRLPSSSTPSTYRISGWRHEAERYGYVVCVPLILRSSRDCWPRVTLKEEVSFEAGRSSVMGGTGRGDASRMKP